MRLRFLNPLYLVRFLCLRAAIERHRRSGSGLKETLALARALVAVGEEKNALTQLQAARRLFPESVEAAALTQETQAKLTRREIRVLERSTRRDASAESRARLIELYRCAGRLEEAREQIQQAVEQFPDDWSIKLAAGKAFYQLFLKSRRTEDGAEGAEHLRHARRLAPASQKALFYLAALAIEIGPAQEAQSLVAELEGLAQTDRRARDFLEFLAKKAIAKSGSCPADGADPNDAWAPLIDELRAQAGAQSLLVFSAEGKLEHSWTAAGGSPVNAKEKEIASWVAGLRSSSERLGIGSLLTCVVDVGSGAVSIAASPERTLVALIDAEGNSRTADSILARVFSEAQPA